MEKLVDGTHMPIVQRASYTRGGCVVATRGIWKGPRSGGRIILVISDALRQSCKGRQCGNQRAVLGRSRAGW